MSNEKKMKTVSAIETLLHIYWSPEPCPSVRDRELQFLLDEGLIEKHDTWYSATERGKVYCEAIWELPWPVQKWTMP